MSRVLDVVMLTIITIVVLFMSAAAGRSVRGYYDSHCMPGKINECPGGGVQFCQYTHWTDCYDLRKR
jgi:hypothetical protein